MSTVYSSSEELEFADNWRFLTKMDPFRSFFNLVLSFRCWSDWPFKVTQLGECLTSVFLASFSLFNIGEFSRIAISFRSASLDFSGSGCSIISISFGITSSEVLFLREEVVGNSYLSTRFPMLKSCKTGMSSLYRSRTRWLTWSGSEWVKVVSKVRVAEVSAPRNFNPEWKGCLFSGFGGGGLFKTLLTLTHFRDFVRLLARSMLDWVNLTLACP